MQVSRRPSAAAHERRARRRTARLLTGAALAAAALAAGGEAHAGTQVSTIAIPLNTTGNRDLASRLAAMSTASGTVNAPAPGGLGQFAVPNPETDTGNDVTGVFDFLAGDHPPTGGETVTIPSGSTLMLVDFDGVVTQDGSGAPQTPVAKFEIQFIPPGAKDPGYVIVALNDADLHANAISGTASVVGRYSALGDNSTAFPGAPGYGAFVWTPAAGLKALPFNNAFGISLDGSVIVGGTSAAQDDPISGFPSAGHAVRYTAALGAIDLGTLSGPTGNSVAIAVSADGKAVAGNSSLDAYTVTDDVTGPFTKVVTEAFRWDLTDAATGAGTMTDLGHLPDAGVANVIQNGQQVRVAVDNGFSAVAAISQDGSTVVGWGNAANSDPAAAAVDTHALRWVKGGAGPQDLGTLPGLSQSQAAAVSADGAIVVGSAFSPVDIFATNNAYSTGALAVSIPSTSRAFRWTAATGIADLNTLLTSAGLDLKGSVLLTATSISPDGQYIGGQYAPPGPAGTTAVLTYLARYIDPAVVLPPTTPTEPTTPTTPTTPIAGLTTTASVQASIDQLARARTRLLVQGRGFLSPITDDADPFLAPTQAHAFLAGDDLNGGFRGRLSSAHGLMLLGGVSWGDQTYTGVRETRVTSGTVALRYAPPLFRTSRPFIEIGYFTTHADGSRFTRTYDNGDGVSTGSGGASSNGSDIYGRLGWIWTPTPADQVGVYVDYGRQRQAVGAYVEALTADNPFEAHVSGGGARQDTAHVGVRYSHDPARGFSWGLSAAAGHGFDADAGLDVGVPGFGQLRATPTSDPTWIEYTARLGYAVAERVTVSAFVTGVAGADVGSHARPGVDLRLVF